MAVTEPAAKAGSACSTGALRIIFYSMAWGMGATNLGFGIARHPRSFAVTARAQLRALATSAALAAGLALAGCNSDEISLANNAKANQPVPPKLVADMAAKDMDINSPILVRLFKPYAEL